jgi:hypothetical protein
VLDDELPAGGEMRRRARDNRAQVRKTVGMIAQGCERFAAQRVKVRIPGRHIRRVGQDRVEASVDFIEPVRFDERHACAETIGIGARDLECGGRAIDCGDLRIRAFQR